MGLWWSEVQILSPRLEKRGRKHLYKRASCLAFLSPSGQSMKSHFFLTGIVPDFARVAHAFVACFLYPLVHFILILIESVATKDITPSKGGWGSFHTLLEY